MAKFGGTEEFLVETNAPEGRFLAEGSNRGHLQLLVQLSFLRYNKIKYKKVRVGEKRIDNSGSSVRKQHPKVNTSKL